MPSFSLQPPIPEIPLSYCDYDKERKVLKLASEPTGFTGFPSSLFIKSHHTGKQVRFVPVGLEDKLFCQDLWDGEQCIYRPTTDVPGVDHLVIFHAY